MTIGLLFWVLMILTVVFGLFSNKPATGPYPWASLGNWFLIWFLFALLGWATFGPAIHR